MLIDWFTVAAQLLNFLLLLWLLKRFLYKPVLKALDEREQKIAAELAHAADVEETAGKAKAEWQLRNDAFEQKRQIMMQQATDEAGQRRGELFENARHEYENLRTKLLETLKREEAERNEESEHRIRDEIFSITEKMLAELADQSLEALIIDKFCRKLEMSAPDLLAQSAAQNKRTEQAVVRTAFALTPEQQEQLRRTIREQLSTGIPLTFEQSVTNSCGIELCVNDYCVSWHLDAALFTLKQSSETYGKSGERIDAE